MASLEAGLRFALSAAAVSVVAFWTPSAYAQGVPALYKTRCANCHGEDGKGNTPAGKKTKVHDFTSAEVQKMTDAELTTIMTDGRKKMPSYKTKLSADQIAELIKHVRMLGKGG